MRAVYSYRFIQGNIDPSGVTFLIPSGFTAVIRCIDVYWGGGAASPSIFVMGTPLEVTFAFFTPPPPSEASPSGAFASQSWQWRGRQVLVGVGEGIRAYTSGDTVDLTASGYLLEGLPPGA